MYAFSVDNHALQSFEVFSLWQNKFLSICQPVVKKFQTGKVVVFGRKSWLVQQSFWYKQNKAKAKSIKPKLLKTLKISKAAKLILNQF